MSSKVPIRSQARKRKKSDEEASLDMTCDDFQTTKLKFRQPKTTKIERKPRSKRLKSLAEPKKIVTEDGLDHVNFPGCSNKIKIDESLPMNTKELDDEMQFIDLEKSICNDNEKLCPTCKVIVPSAIYNDHFSECIKRFKYEFSSTKSKASSMNEPPTENQIHNQDIQDKSDEKSKKHSTVLPCPICLKSFLSKTAKTSHMKNCANSKGISTEKLLVACRLQEKQAEERSLLGLIPLVSTERKSSRTNAEKPKKTVLKDKNVDTDQALEMGIVLSKSLADKVEVERKELLLNLGIPITHQPKSFKVQLNKKSSQPKSKKIAASSQNKTLHLRTPQERERIKVDKVAAMLIDHDLDTFEPDTSIMILRSSLNNLRDEKNSLWKACSYDKETPLEAFYVSELRSHVTPYLSDPELLFKKVSSIPGRLNLTILAEDSEDEDTMEKSVVDAYCTQLALAELNGSRSFFCDTTQLLAKSFHNANDGESSDMTDEGDQMNASNDFLRKAEKLPVECLSLTSQIENNLELHSLARNEPNIHSTQTKNTENVRLNQSKNNENVTSTQTKNVYSIQSKNNECVISIQIENNESVNSIQIENNENINSTQMKNNESISSIQSQNNANLNSTPTKDNANLNSTPTKDNANLNSTPTKNNANLNSIPTKKIVNLYSSKSKNNTNVNSTKSNNNANINSSNSKNNANINLSNSKNKANINSSNAKNNAIVNSTPIKSTKNINSTKRKHNGSATKHTTITPSPSSSNCFIDDSFWKSTSSLDGIKENPLENLNSVVIDFPSSATQNISSTRIDTENKLKSGNGNINVFGCHAIEKNENVFDTPKLAQKHCENVNLDKINSENDFNKTMLFEKKNSDNIIKKNNLTIEINKVYKISMIDKLVYDWSGLLTTGEKSDVQIVTKDSEVNVHSLVLMARCRLLFEEAKKNDMYIEWKTFSFEGVSLFMTYLYSGNCPISGKLDPFWSEVYDLSLRYDCSDLVSYLECLYKEDNVENSRERTNGPWLFKNDTENKRGSSPVIEVKPHEMILDLHNSENSNSSSKSTDETSISVQKKVKSFYGPTSPDLFENSLDNSNVSYVETRFRSPNYDAVNETCLSETNSFLSESKTISLKISLDCSNTNRTVGKHLKNRENTAHSSVFISPIKNVSPMPKDLQIENDANHLIDLTASDLEDEFSLQHQVDGYSTDNFDENTQIFSPEPNLEKSSPTCFKNLTFKSSALPGKTSDIDDECFVDNVWDDFNESGFQPIPADSLPEQMLSPSKREKDSATLSSENKENNIEIENEIVSDSSPHKFINGSIKNIFFKSSPYKSSVISPVKSSSNKVYSENKLKSLNRSKSSSSGLNENSAKHNITLGDDTMLLAAEEIENNQITKPKSHVEQFKRRNETPLQKSMNISMAVTPKPDFVAMSSPELKKVLFQYGVRPISRKKAVAFLDFIYEKIHPIITDSEAETSLNMTPVKVMETKNKFVQKRKLLGSSKGLIKQVNNRNSSKICSKKKKITETSPKDSLNSSFSSSSSNDLSRNENQFLLDDDSNLSHDESFSSVDKTVNLNKQIHDYIKSDLELYNKILLYEPIWIEKLKENLKINGIKCNMKQLQDFLDEKCITFRLHQEQRNRNRRRKLPKDKLKSPIKTRKVQRKKSH